MMDFSQRVREESKKQEASLFLILVYEMLQEGTTKIHVSSSGLLASNILL